MRVALRFNEEYIRKLYRMYHERPKDYKTFKEKSIGDGAQVHWQREVFSRARFMLIITFIALAGSAFAVFAGDAESRYGILGAIWVIWLGFALFFFVLGYAGYRHGYLIVKNNEALLAQFESLVAICDNEDVFFEAWKKDGPPLFSPTETYV